MLAFLRRARTVKVLLVEKTDRLYRNLKDWVSIDELELEVHFSRRGSFSPPIPAPRKSSCTGSRS